MYQRPHVPALANQRFPEGNGSAGGSGAGAHADPQRRRRFRGQYFRRRTPSSGGYQGGHPSGGRGGNAGGGGSFSDDRNDSSPPRHNSNNYHHHKNETVDDVYDQNQHQDRSNVQRPFNRNLRQHRSRFQYYSSRLNQQRNDRPSYPNNRADDNIDNADDDYGAGQVMRQAAAAGSNSTGGFDEVSTSIQRLKADFVEIRAMFSRLATELEQVRARVRELELAAGTKVVPKEGGDPTVVDKKALRLMKQREKRAAKQAERRVALRDSKQQQLQLAATGDQQSDPQEQSVTHEGDVEGDGNKADMEAGDTAADGQPSVPIPAGSRINRRTNRERQADMRPARVRRELKEKPSKAKVPKANFNDDSTTQAADPSSEGDRAEGEDGVDGDGKERVRVFRRKKVHPARRGRYGNRRRRVDSSERNSNDTSPQNEVNGTADGGHEKKQSKKPMAKATYPELSGSEVSDIVQNMKREFLTTERPAKSVRDTMIEKGPKVVHEFAVSILDHAICDVTSPTKLSEISSNLYFLITSNDVNFKQGFYEAVGYISKRGDDIVIDAPRYLDTLGQLLADCIVPLVSKQRSSVQGFMTNCLDAYSKENRASFLASIMKGIASTKSERFAKEVWDLAALDWSRYILPDVNLEEFLDSHDVKFTTRAFTPEPRAFVVTPKELERFADDVTDLVERNCVQQTLTDMVSELNAQGDEEVAYLGTLVYAVVRGCIITDAGDYKLNAETLAKYSPVLKVTSSQQDAIALHALTALTKLWQHYNCPQDLMRNILITLHNLGVASLEALKTWLYSDNLTNVPGIGAARLSSRRLIEDLVSVSDKDSAQQKND